jgi:Domain of unknown function (DUF4296)
MSKLIGPLVFFVVLTACADSGKAPIPVDSMKVIVWEMSVADEWFNEVMFKDSVARQQKLNTQLYQKVLAAHGISRKDFDAAMRWYEARPKQYLELMDSTVAFAVRAKEIPPSQVKPRK